MATKKTDASATATASLNQLEGTLSMYFLDKAPKMPADIQEIIVKFGPWLIIIGLLMAVPAIFAALGLSAVVSPLLLLAGPRTAAGFSIVWVFMLITVVLELLALPGLFKRQMQGWKYMYYATLVGVVENIVMLNVVGLIIGAGLGFYILFQIKHLYK